ncbi:PIG-L family deacetylase [Kitasatospora sp. NPDC096077]|uniref:PIG-L deacetylase family protein n=1 Tax=Kitasatospora sp. NPDC096077 TaxID=3155544 RepID=UPI0033294F8B
MSGLLLVAPHPDDIALSVGGWLGALVDADARAGRDRSITLLTVFTRSRWAPYAPGAEGLDEDGVRKLREAEDAAYAHSLRLSYTALGLPDSSALGMDDDAELNEPDGSAASRAREQEAAEAMRPHLDAAALVVAPSAVGGHIDHRLVRRAVGRCPGPQLRLWYEDLPYALTPSAPRPRWDDVEPVGLGLEFTLGRWAEPKRVGLGHYASQLTGADVAGVLRHGAEEGGPAVERVWLAPSDAGRLGRCRELGLTPAGGAPSAS